MRYGRKLAHRLLWKWTERVTYVFWPQDILAECPEGRYWLPSKTKPDWWDRPFTFLNPTHWPYYWRARRARQLLAVGE